MPDDRQVAVSRSIQRSTGTTFYVATRLLPERVRGRTHVLYAFFRIADEVVDDPAAADRPAAEKRAALERLRQQVLGEAEPEHPVVEAVRDVKAAVDIPDREFDLFLDAMIADVSKRRYRDLEELRGYMRGSAAAVGAMMTAVMDPRDRERALPHARALGEALQLTNFLRDVREDVVDRDRIYLPAATLARYGVDQEQVAALEHSAGLADAVRDLVGTAETFYRRGVAGIDLLPRDCQFPVLLAAVLYADYHRGIRAREFDVLSDPPTLSRPRLASLLCRTRLRWALSKDPTSVFESVAPLEPPATQSALPSDPHVPVPDPGS